MKHPGLGERIRQARKSHGWTQADLGEKIGKSATLIRDYEQTGTEKGRIQLWRHEDLLKQIAEVLCVSVDWLLHGENAPQPADAQSMSSPKSLAGTPLGRLRVIGATGAGDGESNLARDEDLLFVPLSMTGFDRSGWVVKGDSMLPWLQEGDVVVIKQSATPKINFPNLVRDESGEVSLKVVKFSNGKYFLHSLNPSYKDKDAEVQFLGYMVGLYRLQGSKESMEHDPSGLRPD